MKVIESANIPQGFYHYNSCAAETLWLFAKRYLNIHFFSNATDRNTSDVCQHWCKCNDGSYAMHHAL